MSPTISRRSLLGGLAGVGVAALASGPTPRVTAATEWEQVVAAAKKEGKVAVNTFTGQGYARIFKLFSQAYPEIKLDHTNLESDAFAPRLVQERKAGIYTWDVTTIPTSTALQVMKQSGVWDPIRPVITQPEARSDASWRGGLRGRLPRPRQALLRVHAGPLARRVRERRPGEGGRAA